MTVKIRPLIRVAGAGVIPPPPQPYMFFSQQPTDTIAGELFSPTIAVTLSDGANDTLLLTSDNCAFLGFQYATAVGGVAMFPGLVAVIPSGLTTVTCNFRVNNISRPQVSDVVSSAFTISEAVVIPSVQIVNGGTAYGVEQTPDGASLNFQYQWNGNIWDTTGANLRIYFLGNFWWGGNNGTAQRFRTWTNTAWDLNPFAFITAFPDIIGGNAASGGMRQICDFWINPDTGPLSGGSAREPGGAAWDPANLTYPVVAFFALNGVNTATPIAAQATNDVPNAGNTAGLVAPLTVNASGMMITVIIGEFNGAIAPAGYPNMITLPRAGPPGSGLALAIAWKFGSFTVENPVWTFTGTGGYDIPLSVLCIQGA